MASGVARVVSQRIKLPPPPTIVSAQNAKILNGIAETYPIHAEKCVANR